MSFHGSSSQALASFSRKGVSNFRTKLWPKIVGFLIGLSLLGLPVAAAAQGNVQSQGNPPEQFRDVLPFQTGPRATPIENLPTRFQSLAQIVATIFNIVIGIAGSIFMVLLLIGGIQYMTAAGNEENTGKAKKLLVDAVIGLVLTLSAWAIGTFILRQFYLPTSGVVPMGGGGVTGGRQPGTIVVPPASSPQSAPSGQLAGWPKFAQSFTERDSFSESCIAAGGIPNGVELTPNERWRIDCASS